MSAELLERIAILEREKTELVATLAARDSRIAGLEAHSYAVCGDLAGLQGVLRDLRAELAERDARIDLLEGGIADRVYEVGRLHLSLRKMHRRAQKAEGRLAKLDAFIDPLLRSALCMLDDAESYKPIAERALSEGLKECERLRGLLADASKSITWLLGAQAASLRAANNAECVARLAMSEGLKECERLRRESAYWFAECRKEFGNAYEAEGLAMEALRFGLEECERLRKANVELEATASELLEERDGISDVADELAYAIGGIEEIGEHTNMNDPWANAVELVGTFHFEFKELRELAAKRDASLDNAFRMLAHAEMDAEAAKKRVRVLTEALEKVEFAGHNGRCEECDAHDDSYFDYAKPHHKDCLVGIALGRIPAEVPTTPLSGAELADKFGFKPLSEEATARNIAREANRLKNRGGDDE